MQGRLRRPLRILAIGSSASNHVVNRVRCFGERGHEVFLLSELRSGVEGVTELVPSVASGRDEWVRMMVRGLERLMHRKILGSTAMVRLLLDFRWLVNQANPDVIHAHYAYATWAWSAAVLGLKPLVVSVMGGDVLFEEQGSPTPRGIRLTKKLFHSADLITAKSNFLIDALNSLGGYGEKAIRVVWGVDPDVFKPLDAGALRAELGIAPDAKVVLSAKILAPFYNVDIIVEAMPKIVEQEPKAILVVTEYGATPDYRAKLDARIAALGLRRNVQFVGKVDYERMPAFYSMADVSVGIPKSDGLPQTLLEAMACGVPNVIGRLDRYDEIVRDGESAVFADIAPDGVADAVLRVLRDQPLSRRIADVGRKIVMEQANFPRDVQRVENAYYDLVGRRNLVRLPRPMMLSDIAMYWLGR